MCVLFSFISNGFSVTCIYIYIYMSVCVCVCVCIMTKKSLNGTLAIDSPFQTLAVDLSLNL